MTSSRRFALASAALLALVLLLRPLAARLGSPEGRIRAPQRVGQAPPTASRTPSAAGPSQHWPAVANAILEFTNDERRHVGLSALAPEPRLAGIAVAHCDDMLARAFFAHVNPDGDGPSERVARGHRRLIGTSAENLWMGSGFVVDDPRALARQVVRNWMGSQGHRENILRPELTHLGVGVSSAGQEVRATQLFGRVWGYLDADVPASLRVASSPRLGSHPYRGAPAPVRVDLFADGRPRWGPVPLEGAALDVTPGSYLLRFHLPRPGGYLITYGPAVRIVP